MPSSSRTAQCGIAEARGRLRTARAYLEVADLVLSEADRDEYLNVSAGLAVLAGIAAADAICCARLRGRHRGDNHRDAADLPQPTTASWSSPQAKQETLIAGPRAWSTGLLRRQNGNPAPRQPAAASQLRDRSPYEIARGRPGLVLGYALRAHAGRMNSPSDSTVTPCGPMMCPLAQVLMPSLRSIQASARSFPSGVGWR
jgi:hypothetical protein